MATKPLCSIPGCGKPKAGRGWCTTHYWRWKHNGDPLALKPKAILPTTCCVDGCGNPRGVGRRGMCGAHYQRQNTYGRLDLVRAENGEPERWLRDHVTHNDEACLVWPFATGRDGRGRVNSEIAPQAHRAMCILAHGPAPSIIHEAAHSCGKGHGGCVNPKHLRWATPVENAADRFIHGTQPVGENHSFAKLNAEEVREIRALKGVATQADIGSRFGVDAETIGNIHRRETWAWLE